MSRELYKTVVDPYFMQNLPVYLKSIKEKTRTKQGIIYVPCFTTSCNPQIDIDAIVGTPPKKVVRGFRKFTPGDPFISGCEQCGAPRQPMNAYLAGSQLKIVGGKEWWDTFDRMFKFASSIVEKPVEPSASTEPETFVSANPELFEEPSQPRSEQPIEQFVSKDKLIKVAEAFRDVAYKRLAGFKFNNITYKLVMDDTSITQAEFDEPA